MEREIGSFDEKQNLVEFRALGIGKGAEIGASISIELGNKIYCPIHD
ncbi:MAG: hypothetical protein QRY74_05435 [Chlamydia sp.]